MTISTFNPVDLGNIIVYQKTTMQHPMGDGKFYYTDKRFGWEHGPFLFIAAAVEHHTENYRTDDEYFPLTAFHSSLTDFLLQEDVQKPIKPAPNAKPKKSNVIHVDFRAKKRIS